MNTPKPEATMPAITEALAYFRPTTQTKGPVLLRPEEMRRHLAVIEAALAGRAGATPGEEAGSDYPRLDIRVDGQVWGAARHLSPDQETYPAWLWFAPPNTISYGRWPKHGARTPYVRADIALAALRADPTAGDRGSGAPLTGTGWQPISTAPKDGQAILVWGLDWGGPKVVAADGGWWNLPPSMRPSILPTHWMPLPTFPLHPHAEGNGHG